MENLWFYVSQFLSALGYRLTLDVSNTDISKDPQTLIWTIFLFLFLFQLILFQTTDTVKYFLGGLENLLSDNRSLALGLGTGTRFLSKTGY